MTAGSIRGLTWISFRGSGTEVFRVFVLAVVLLTPRAGRAQGTLSISTDKPSYDYGESMVIAVTITNETAVPFVLTGSSSCQGQFKFDDYDSSQRPCTTDHIEINFNPGSWRRWTFTVTPAEMGLPGSDGEHTVVGFYPGTAMADTMTVTAPAYFGGQLDVSIKSGVEEAQLAPLMDSLNVRVLWTHEWSNGSRAELWQIQGTTVDDAVAIWGSDSRFESFVAHRWLSDYQVTRREDHVIREPLGVEVYPNPCASDCWLSWGSSATSVRVEVFDLLGRQVLARVLPTEPHRSGSRVSLSGGSLNSGLYMVILKGGGRTVRGVFLKTD